VSLAAWQADARAFATHRTAWDRTLARNRAWQTLHANNRPRETTRWGAQREWRVAETDVARTAVQRAPQAQPGQSSFAQQKATERTWRDQRALIDHQLAASQAAQRQLDQARAFARARGFERSGQSPGGFEQRSERVTHAPAARAYAAGPRAETVARFHQPSFWAGQRFRSEARGEGYGAAGAARSAFGHGADAAARTARMEESQRFSAPRFAPEPRPAPAPHFEGGGPGLQGGGAHAEPPAPHAEIPAARPTPQNAGGGGHGEGGGQGAGEHRKH
jgi:hypothetical protein